MAFYWDSGSEYNQVNLQGPKMKILLMVTSLLIIASCTDAGISRPGKCISANKRMVVCSRATSGLSTDEYQLKYIAEITTDISVGQKQLILNESVSNEDTYNDYTCSISVTAGKIFNYSISNGVLLLNDGLNTLTLTKKSGSNSNDLITTWTMETVTKNEQIITELEFLSEEELRIKKICNVK